MFRQLILERYLQQFVVISANRKGARQTKPTTIIKYKAVIPRDAAFFMEDNMKRMTHKDGVALNLFESNGVTSTKWSLFEGKTREECLKEAARLGLVVPDEVNE